MNGHMPTWGSTLSSRILCGRHNGALSHLDTVASAFFQAFRDEQAEMMLHRETDTEFRCAFAVLNGPTLQLWLLKVLWVRSFPVSQRSMGGLPTDSGSVSIRRSWRRFCGRSGVAHYLGVLHVPRSFEGLVRMNSAGLRFINVGPEIVGGTVKLSGFDFCLAFERPHVPLFASLAQ